MPEYGATVVGDGVLTANPEIRDAGQSKVANFTLAFNYTWGKGDDQKRDTAFIECEAWGWLAEYIVNNAGKGTKLGVWGRLVQKSWEKDGKRHSKLSVRIERANLIQRTGNGNGNGQPRARANGDQGGSGGQSAQSGQSGPPVNQQVEPEVPEEDIPF